MTKRLLYLMGEPGTGKITVGRILQKRLGWRLFWLHDLDAVCKIVGRYPLPRLMDAVSLAVLQELMLKGDNIIYVRPSREARTIFKVLDTAHLYGYRETAVRLTATYDELVRRVEARGKLGRHKSDNLNCPLNARPPIPAGCSCPSDELRVTTRQGLDDYLQGRKPAEDCERWTNLDTTGLPPERVADKIEEMLSEGA